MPNIKLLLTRKLTSDLLDRRFGQCLCFACGPLILLLVARKLAALGLSEAQLVQGLTSAATLAVAVVILGFCVAPSERKGP